MISAIALAMISAAAGASQPSVIASYTAALGSEVDWAQSVKEAFDDRNIRSTCANYRTDDYSNCYLQYVLNTSRTRELTTTGYFLLFVEGVRVITADFSDINERVRAPVRAVDKLNAAFKKSIGILEVGFALLQKDQDSRRTRNLPRGPGSEVLELVTGSLDDKFQVETLKKLKEVFEKSGKNPCLLQNTCPVLAGRFSALGKQYRQVLTQAPRAYHELTETELNAAAVKARLSADDLRLLHAERASQK